MEVNKAMLKVMLIEYWATDNNPTCTAATVWFLKQLGFNEREISEVINEPFDNDNIEEIVDNIKDEMRYYQ